MALTGANFRVTITGADGNSKTTVVGFAAGARIAANFTKLDCSWSGLLAAGLVDATIVPPITRVLVEVESMGGVGSTAEVYWGLLVG